MTYIEFTRESCRKVEGKKLYKVKSFTEEQLEAFRQMLSGNASIADMFNRCESAKSFFRHYPDFKEMGINNSELFYQFKLGYGIEGVPSELVFILNKAISTYGIANPNSTLWTCYKLISQYAECSFNLGSEEVNLQEVIYAIFQQKFDFITPRRNISGCEVYVHNKDSIALLPENIINEIDGRKVYYDKDGLYVGEDRQLLRLMCGRIGATLDDFDLRESV